MSLSACGGTAPSTAAENERIVRELYEEGWNGGSMEVVDRLVAETWIRHDAFYDGEPATQQDVRDGIASLRTGFPDLRVEIDGLTAEDDRVAYRFESRGTHTGELFGLAPTGREVSWEGIAIVRIEDGRIREMWSSFDRYGMLEQLGALPTASD